MCLEAFLPPSPAAGKVLIDEHDKVVVVEEANSVPLHMDEWNIVAIGGALTAIIGGLAAIGSAFYAGRQARSAKAQAYAAHAQVALMRDQVEEARKANQLAERMLKDEAEARRFRLKLSAYPEKEGDEWFLVLKVDNNCSQTANIQSIAIVFADGTRWSDGRFRGQIGLTNSQFSTSGLLGQLEHGQSFTFRFGREVRLDPEDNLYLDARFAAPDYGEGRWRQIESIEVKASNERFFLTGIESSEQPPHWKNQFQSYPTRNPST